MIMSGSIKGLLYLETRDRANCMIEIDGPFYPEETMRAASHQG